MDKFFLVHCIFNRITFIFEHPKIEIKTNTTFDTMHSISILQLLLSLSSYIHLKKPPKIHTGVEGFPFNFAVLELDHMPL